MCVSHDHICVYRRGPSVTLHNLNSHGDPGGGGG